MRTERGIPQNSPGRRRLMIVVGAVLVCFASVMIAACGGGGSSSSESSSSETTTASPTASKGLKEAEAVFAKATVRPTKIASTVPVGKKIPSGKNITFLNCGVGPCPSYLVALERGAKKLGWHIKSVDLGLTPQKIAAAYEQAAREEPDAILASGAAPKSLYERSLKEIDSDGIPLVACCGNETAEENEITAMFYGPNVEVLAGERMAAAVATGAGEDAKVLYVDVPEYATAVIERESFEEHLKQFAPGSSVEAVELPTEEIGQTSKIVSALRANPDVEYIAAAFSPLTTGLDAAISDSGLNPEDYKTVTYGLEPTTLQLMEEGKVNGTMLLGGLEIGWQYLYTLALVFTGQEEKLDRNLEMPTFWITNESASQLEPAPGDEATNVKDYEEQYEALLGF